MHISTPTPSAPARRLWATLTLSALATASLALVSLSVPFIAQAQMQSPTCANQYTVKVGDSLNKIAVADGVTWPVLQALNGIINQNLIFAGEVLCLPNPLPTPTAQPSATVTNVPTATSTGTVTPVVSSTPTLVPTATTVPPTPVPLPIVYPSIGFDRGLTGPGDTITVTGINFPANATAQVYYKPLISPDAYVPIAQTTVSATGTVNFSMTVPTTYEGVPLFGAVSILVRDPVSGYYGFSFFYSIAGH